MSRSRTLAFVVAVAAGSGTIGFIVADHVESPAERAARAKPPVATPVTALVERRSLESNVVTRADMVFDGALAVEVDISSLADQPMVTALDVTEGDTIAEGQVLAGINGRPVVALTGEIPVYRTMQPGTSGPDVRQLEAALTRLGFDPGSVDDVYDAQTSAAVVAMYGSLGYAPPEASPGAMADLDVARQADAAASDALDAAQAALAAASEPPAASERLAADAAVNDAQRTLDAAAAAGDRAAEDAAAEQLAIAIERRRELIAAPDVTAQQAAVTEAQAMKEQADLQLWDATVAAGAPTPSVELVFVPVLPRRVDAVHAERGRPLDGALVTLTGVELVAHATLTAADRSLLAVGMPAEVGGGGITAAATISALETDPTTGTSTAVITLDAPSAATVATLAGLNVKVTIPIATTDGDQLVVPLAALTAGGDGEARVEVVAADGSTSVVLVEVGLAADGFAEVHAREPGTLRAGDAVVVGI